MLDVRLQLMWVLALYTGHFTLHAFSALVSFGSDDLNEPSTKSKFAVRTDGGHEWRLSSRKLSSLLLLF